VQVHHDEGVANRIDPESCADTREGIGEALTGERIGQPLSRESTLILGADVVPVTEGNTDGRDNASAQTARRGLRHWHVRALFSGTGRSHGRPAPACVLHWSAFEYRHLRLRLPGVIPKRRRKLATIVFGFEYPRPNEIDLTDSPARSLSRASSILQTSCHSRNVIPMSRLISRASVLGLFPNALAHSLSPRPSDGLFASASAISFRCACFGWGRMMSSGLTLCKRSISIETMWASERQ
jgi:hypothetical protein